MGLDISYQAMPEGCTLLERARHEPKFGAYLEFFNSYAFNSQQALARSADDPVVVEFVAEAKQVAEHYKGIEDRRLYLGRRWDILYYVLSENRRRSKKKDCSDWVEQAIFGGEVLNQATQTTIGFPIRYLPPIEVWYIAEILKDTNLELFRCHWNPRAMAEASVYKIHAEDGDEEFEWVKQDFEKLKVFYAQVAQHHEGVLTFVG